MKEKFRRKSRDALTLLCFQAVILSLFYIDFLAFVFFHFDGIAYKNLIFFLFYFRFDHFVFLKKLFLWTATTKGLRKESQSLLNTLCFHRQKTKKTLKKEIPTHLKELLSKECFKRYETQKKTLLYQEEEEKPYETLRRHNKGEKSSR